MAFSVSSVLTSSVQITCQCSGESHLSHQAVVASSSKCCHDGLSRVRSGLLRGSSFRHHAQAAAQCRQSEVLPDVSWSNVVEDDGKGRFSRLCCGHEKSAGKTREWRCLSRLRGDLDGSTVEEEVVGAAKGSHKVAIAGGVLKDESPGFINRDAEGFLVEEALPFDDTSAEFMAASGEEASEKGRDGSDVANYRHWPDDDISYKASTSGKSPGEDDKERNRFRIRNGREVYEERAYLVGIERKDGPNSLFSISESLAELTQLADTAGLVVVGSTYQKLEHPNPKSYIGSGKVGDVKAAIRAFDVETVIFDDELSPGQLRNLEREFGNGVRVCDRTALILDIFNQRAATREASLQVELAQFEYQLPRLTRMWSHLERQAGGLVKGMGEKQIEIDKRLLRTKIAGLKSELESVRDHRQQYRDRRASVPIPVLSLVGYTNAGKSTLLNRLSNAGVLAEDQLFATLDPTTRRVELPNGKEVLFTDTVGFIQKLPTQLVAAFRATLEEISDSSLMLHVIDISHPMARQQIEAVNKVLGELDVGHIPLICVWNKIDGADNPRSLRAEAAQRGNVVCISALSGEGMDEFFQMIESKMKDLLVRVQAVVPYGQGELVNSIHRLGIVEREEYIEQGTLVTAHVPLALSRQLMALRQEVTQL